MYSRVVVRLPRMASGSALSADRQTLDGGVFSDPSTVNNS